MNKPKIRHCRNCQYHKVHYIGLKDFNFETYTNCRVKYKDIRLERLTALLCRHYKEATEEYR